MKALPPHPIALVTSRQRLHPDARTRGEQIRALERMLDEAIEAGVDIIQLREPDLGGRILLELTRRTAERARPTGTIVVVNERADVALAAGADGVHLRATGVPVARARALARPWLVGRSAHAVTDAGACAGTDYVVFGTVFPSASKPGVRAAGLDALRAVVAVMPAPVLAIGGVDPARAAACVAAGAAGVAAIGLFLPEGRAPGALGVREATARLRLALAQGAAERGMLE